ncbi:D-amino acid aminotransferase [Glycocaulis alkaliphilus]|uniref:Probable branched-chain-amino-acid aminotransferase n=1 Tax=Glycocaulis alkaliphilus TaxID=1434191 RepID=A0A3T0E9M5_9PROT|nr:D-amino-acid transaminase [Glycocaulis alkaliphilus]AZU04034.1 D-amino acid aminotransferase [Glycocaulis alkaliphilus]GGB75261.1 D-amino-acid transaminase [Glycocaulis alkaliphilus]
MARIAYVNGCYLPIDAPAIQIEDRGFQFSDGVYEVWLVRDGQFLDHAGHLERLKRSLGELRIDLPMSDAALDVALRETLRRNRLGDALVYLQVTRGAARRDHAFPLKPVRPTIVITVRPAPRAPLAARAETGIGVITANDIRWKRCDIKSISLLPNVLAKQAAREAGAFEAWLINADGEVTEGSSSNAWIVTGEGALVTRPAGDDILNGITRQRIIRIAAAQGLRLEERAFTVEEALSAREAFISSATSMVMPVVSIDGRPVANGAPGSLAGALRESYEAGEQA